MTLFPLLLACSLRVDPPAAGDAAVFEVVSPSPDAVVRVSRLPLMVRLTEPYLEGRVEVLIDDRLVTDPLALTGYRNNRLGGGIDHLAWLDLSELEPGPHELTLRLTSSEGRTLTQQHGFTWDRPPHRVRLSARDPSGAPLDARVVVLRDGAPYPLVGPDAEAADPRNRDARLHAFFLTQDTRDLWLDPGEYELIATAGLRRSIDARRLDLRSDVELEFTLEEQVPTPGWLSADLHVHTGRSRDAFIPERLRVESLLAAGLDLVVISDHDEIGGIDASLAALARSHDGLWALPGIEGSLLQEAPDALEEHRSMGHLNAFPLLSEDYAPQPESLGRTPAGVIDAWRARQALAPYPGVDGVLLQLNHPRGIHFQPEQGVRGGAHALFQALDYRRGLPLSAPENAALTAAEPVTGTTALSWDAIELINRFSLKLYRRVRLDWFALLRQGVFITATGNSDSHAATVELAGAPINLIRCPTPEVGAPLQAACVIEAIRAGEVSVSTGPVVELEVVGDGDPVGVGGIVRATEGRVRARLRVRAAAWVPVHELRLIVNGEVTWSEDVSGLSRDGVGEWVRELPVQLDADAWLVAEAGWPLESRAPEDDAQAFGAYAFVLPGHVPVGFTNPVRVDVGEEGWAPPGLPPPE